MASTILALATVASMALGLVSAGINFKTIYDIEMDRSYVAATDNQLAEQYTSVEEKLNDARRRNDLVAAAEYETVLNGIRKIRDRSNITAIGRQVEQKKEAFIEEQWSVFQANVAIGIVSSGMGMLGHGKVTDTFMKGQNWPPGKNFATWNPLSGQAERFILGGKPELIMIEFSDELADFMTAILNGFDVARSTTASGDIQSAYDASTFVSEELDQIKDARPLPKDIGDYLAESIAKKIKRENPQIASESLGDRAIFVRGESCQALNKMWLEDQADLNRSEALWAAMQKLECGQLAKGAGPSESDQSDEEEAALPEEGKKAEEPATPPETGKKPDEPAAPPEDEKTAEESAAQDVEWPDDPCVFMPPGLSTARMLDGKQCVIEYSLDPFLAANIVLLEKGSFSENFCSGNSEDESMYIIEELDMGDCGYRYLFNFIDKADFSNYTSWGIEFLNNLVLVNVHTNDVYPNNEAWIQSTVSEIEKKVDAYMLQNKR